MHWRVAVAGALILALLAGGFFLLHHLNSVYDSIIENIDRSIEAVMAAGGDDGQGIYNAKEIWEANLSLICTFVIHSQVDSISQRLELAVTHLEEQAWAKYIDLLREIRFGLELLKDYDRPTIRSVL